MAGKFKGPVVGPVGKYVKIQNGKEQWAKLAEFAIGNGNLDRFIVSNNADMELMKKLRREVSCGPRDCGLYQISSHATKDKYKTPNPPEGVELVTSVISVDNAMAFNFLVDSCKIDQSALAETKESGEKALLVIEGGKKSMKSKNVKKVFSLPAGDMWDVRNGELGMTSNDRQLKQTIGVDKSKAIEAGKLEARALEEDVKRCKQEEKSITNEAFKVS